MLARVAIVRRTHWASSGDKISGEVLVRVARRGAVASATTTASSRALWAIAMRGARERIGTIVVGSGGASEGVGDWTRGQFSPNNPGVVTREEREVSGLGHQMVQALALDREVRRVALNEV